MARRPEVLTDGHDVTADAGVVGCSPFDASLDRFVDLTKPEVVGKVALTAEQIW